MLRQRSPVIVYLSHFRRKMIQFEMLFILKDNLSNFQAQNTAILHINEAIKVEMSFVAPKSAFIFYCGMIQLVKYLGST